MADITVTANSVVTTSTQTETLTAGAAVTPGQTVYKDSSDSDKAKLSDANVTAAQAVTGIALNTAATGQPVTILKNGGIITGGLGSLTAGDDYYLSATPGGICPKADLTTNDRIIRVGRVNNDGNLLVAIEDYGVTL